MCASCSAALCSRLFLFDLSQAEAFTDTVRQQLAAVDQGQVRVAW